MQAPGTGPTTAASLQPRAPRAPRRTGQRAAVRDYATPLRFGRVTRGSRAVCVFRGAYPTLPHFRWLKSLKLRTILSLTPEPPSADIVRFGGLFNVNIIHIPIVRTERTRAIQRHLTRAVTAMADPANLPLYVHCLDGRRITSLAVLLLRRLQGWCVDAAIEEYWRHQPPIRPPVSDVASIDRDLTRVFYDNSEEIQIPLEIPSWLWEGDRSRTGPAGMRLKFAKTAEEIEQENQLAAAHTGAGATDLSGSLDSSGVAAGLQALMAGPPGPSAGVYTYLEDALTPLAEAKTRYSFSGRAARDAVGTGTGRDGSYHKKQTPNKLAPRPSLSEDKTVSALDLAVPEQSPAKALFMRNAGRHTTQEL